MAEIHGTLNRLIKYGLENELIVDYDEIWVRNELMDLFHLKEWKEMPISACMMPKYPQSILDTLCDYAVEQGIIEDTDRKSTRLNSSHANISYAVFCLKKKKKNN